MKTRYYKTLRGLLSQNAGQLNFNDFHANQFYHKTAGWVTFRLPEEEKDKGYKILASAIYSNGNKMYERLKYYHGRSCGILNRIFFCRHEHDRATYCAGQDYVGEIRFIQNLLRNNS